MRSVVPAFLLLFVAAYCYNVCPNGYAQAPNGGYCYMANVYYNTFIQQFDPETYNYAEYDCKDSGGYLASIHSQEENDFALQVMDASKGPCCSPFCYPSRERNIGLRCKGKTCKWDDGSNVTFTNFQEVPADDGKERCYGFASFGKSWVAKDCDKKYQSDCWICSAKPKQLDCADGETPYNGGCASVYTWPADEKNAEENCPGGGHLVSIHSNSENSFYSELATNAGVTGTIFIGGLFSNGKFEWIDGSNYEDINQWANGFPNPIFGSCMQMLLSSQFGVQGQWTNVECSVKQPYICFRNGKETVPTSLPLTPKADSQCPPIQYYNGSGFFYSPNYPLSIPRQQTCEYHLESKDGTKASVIFHAFNCQSGTTLALFDGLNDDQPFITFTKNTPPPNQAYTATSNVLKIIFSASGKISPVGTGWEAEFTGK